VPFGIKGKEVPFRGEKEDEKVLRLSNLKKEEEEKEKGPSIDEEQGEREKKGGADR